MKTKQSRRRPSGRMPGQVQVRMDLDLLDLLDRHVEDVRRAHPGLLVTRASAIRTMVLMTLGRDHAT
jgi:hypothetical protein